MTCNKMAFFPSNFILQTLQEHDSQASASLNHVLPSCTSQEFHGKKSTSFSGIDVCPEEANNGEDEISDDGSQAGEKKRRLNMEQVETLEKNFELGNKLDPQRKMELAKALGLQPRQIAIWFQNRRARWKIKQLEKDYDMLKRVFEGIRAENVALQAQNQKLHAEILALKSRDSTESINLDKETEGSCSNKRENSSETKLDIYRTHAAIYNPISNNPITSIPLFPPSSYIRSPPIVAQVLFQQNPYSKPNDHFQCQNQMVKEESLSNMFCGIDDQPGFWPWLEQHHFS